MSRTSVGQCDITNSIYLPRDEVCKRRRTHTRQINLVGLKRRPEWPIVVASGCKLASRLLEQIMTGRWSFVSLKQVSDASIELAHDGAARCWLVYSGEECSNAQTQPRTIVEVPFKSRLFLD